MTIVKRIVMGIGVFILGYFLIVVISSRMVDFPIDLLNHYRIIYSILFLGAIISVAAMAIVDELRALRK